MSGVVDGTHPLGAYPSAAQVRARFDELLHNMPAHYDEPGVWDEQSVAFLLIQEVRRSLVPAIQSEGEASEQVYEALLSYYWPHETSAGDKGDEVARARASKLAQADLDAYRTAVRAALLAEVIATVEGMRVPVPVTHFDDCARLVYGISVECDCRCLSKQAASVQRNATVDAILDALREGTDG